jgi:hypothetical protein
MIMYMIQYKTTMALGGARAFSSEVDASLRRPLFSIPFGRRASAAVPLAGSREENAAKQKI